MMTAFFFIRPRPPRRGGGVRPWSESRRALALLTCLRFAIATTAGAGALPVAHGRTDALPPADALLSRPLFAPDRRPPDTPAPAIENHDPVLTGIVLRQTKRGALFAAPVVGLPSPALSVGAQIEGWTVTEIDADTVTLEKAGRKLMLHPHFGPAPAGIAPATAVSGVRPMDETTPRPQAGPRRILMRH